MRTFDSIALAMLFLFLVVVRATALPPGAEHRGNPAGRIPEAPFPTRAQISQAIALSAGYLERACGPDGKFVYEIETHYGQQASSYNIVRHAGAMYALAMLNRSTPDRNAVDAMVRAATFMRQNYIAQDVHPGQLVVWSEPTGQDSEAELGATGLGLVALTEVRKVAPKSVPLGDLQALGRFALFLQKDDGSFASKYNSETGPEDWDSLYYPGETALGLIGLYETDHSRQWLNAAAKALSYLAKNRTKLSPVPADHWALIAMAKLLPYCDKPSCPVSREELLQYANRVCDSILHDQLRNPAAPLDGAFDAIGVTASAATRMEGLLATLEFLPKNEFRAKVEAAAGRGIAFLLRTQIKSGPYAGGLPSAFLAGAPGTSEIRIDCVQHALSAWLRYQKFTGAGRRIKDHLVAGLGADPKLLPATFCLKKNDLIGRISAIIIGVKIKTERTDVREVPGSLNARETNSGNGIPTMSGRNGKSISGNAQSQTTTNITNHAERTLLMYPVHVTISPMKMTAIEATPSSPIVWAAAL
jgi:hypothetical protein